MTMNQYFAEQYIYQQYPWVCLKNSSSDSLFFCHMPLACGIIHSPLGVINTSGLLKLTLKDYRNEGNGQPDQTCLKIVKQNKLLKHIRILYKKLTLLKQSHYINVNDDHGL